MSDVIDLDAWDDHDDVLAILDDLDPSVASPSKERHQQIGDAVASLLTQDDSRHHWWHDRSPEETVALLEVFAYAKLGDRVDSLAKASSKHLKCCSQCVMAYHTAKAQLKEEVPPAVWSKALAILQPRDEERVAQSLAAAAAGADSDIGEETITVLFEALSFESLLEDAAVMEAAENAILALSEHHDLALSEGGRYPGIYRLLAHSNSNLRAMMGSVSRSLGAFEVDEDIEAIYTVLELWSRLLEGDLLEKERSENGRRRWSQPRQTLWQALNSVLGLMKPPAMLVVLMEFPQILTATVEFACEGSSVSWPALGCLRSIIQSAGSKVWEHLRLSPRELIDRLALILVQSLDARLQAHLINVLKPIAGAQPVEFGRDERGELRRKVLVAFLQRIPATALMHPSTAATAERAAFELTAGRLAEGEPVADDAHIFGPSMCRVLTQQTDEESPNFAAAESLCQQLLDADVDCISAANLPLQNPETATAASGSFRGSARDVAIAATVAPAVWQALASTPHPQICSMLLSAAASLAHVDSRQQGAAGPQSGSVGFHGSGSGLMARVEASKTWPVLRAGCENLSNPSALEVSEAPGLLLQAFREAALKVLAGNLLKGLVPLRAPEILSQDLICAVSQLLVGVHSPLRAAAEASIQDLTDRGSLEDALSFLCWTPSVGESLFAGVNRSMGLINSLTPSQALVRADTRALLSVVLELLQSSEDTAVMACEPRTQLIAGVWQFLLAVLAKGQQAGRFTWAAVSLQRAFDLLPVVWRLTSEGASGGLLAQSRNRPAAKQNMAFMADAFRWGSCCSQAVSKNWVLAMRRILMNLPDSPERCLPAEALEAGSLAMESESGLQDEARVILAPLLKHAAPGNLGQSALASLPRRSKVSLPPLRKPTTAAKALAGLQPDLRASTLDAPVRLGSKSAAIEATARQTEQATMDNVDAQNRDANLVDLTLDDSDETPEAALVARIASGGETSTSRGKGYRSPLPTWMAQAEMPAAALEEDVAAPAADSETEDLPFAEILAGQNSLWDAASKQSSRKEVLKAPKSSGQKTLQGFVSISPHKKGDPKPEPPKLHSIRNAYSVEQLFAEAKAAEKAVRELAAPKSKPKKGLLKAAMDKTEAEMKEANRKLPRSERDPTLPHPSRRKRRRSSTPEEDSRWTDASLQQAKKARAPPGPLQNQGGQPPQAAAKLPALREDSGLDQQLQSAQEKAAPPLDKRAMLGLPAVPKPVRKIIQLAAAPGANPAAHARQRGATPPAAQMVLSLEEVQKGILSWDFYSVVSGQATAKELKSAGSIPTTFDSLSHYTRAFASLLLEELRAHIQQAYEEGPDSGKTSSSKPEPSSVPLHIASLQRRSMLHRIEAHMSVADRAGCRTEDLVLLTIDPPPKAEEKAAMPPRVHLLAMIERVEDDERHKGQKIVTALVNLVSQEAGTSSRLEVASKTLLPGATWHASRVLSWVPHHRQFEALCRAHTLPETLVKQLLNPEPPADGLRNASDLHCLSTRLTAALRTSYNDSQLAAVASSTSDQTQFTLVQGPPGTGKTSTVIAIVSAILAKPPPKGGHQNVQQPPPQKSRGPRGVAPQLAAELPCPPVRVLVCTQSNAAVDELIMRLAEPGIFDAEGNRRIPRVVRLGKAESAHPHIKSFHIDAVADKSSRDESKIERAKGEAAKHQAEVLKLQKQLQDARSALDTAEAEAAEAHEEGTTKGNNLATLKSTRRQLALRLKAAKDQAQRGSEAISRARKEVRQAVVRQAEVVACTLSSAGGDLTVLSKGSSGFQALIIDEAAQALEPAAHIALHLLAKGAKVVLVGDPKQLPATVLSRSAEARNLTQSLFERLQRAAWPVTMLSEQYRMHPEISAWPSEFFYEGKLVDGASMTTANCSADFHSRPCFPPLAVYDCRDGRERGGSQSGGGSLSNASEADLICSLLSGLASAYPDALKGTVAVLTPYRAQMGLLRARVMAALDRNSHKFVEFATVDGFQGKEADIILFSCVRARNPGRRQSVGFLADVRRMNVALTRARRSLWIVGHVETLKGSPPWAALLDHVRDKKRLFTATPPYDDVCSAGIDILRGGTAAASAAHQDVAAAIKGRSKGVVNVSRDTVGTRLPTGAAPNAMLQEAARRANRATARIADSKLKKRKASEVPPEDSARPVKRKTQSADVLTKPANKLSAASAATAAGSRDEGFIVPGKPKVGNFPQSKLSKAKATKPAPIPHDQASRRADSFAAKKGSPKRTLSQQPPPPPPPPPPLPSEDCPDRCVDEPAQPPLPEEDDFEFTDSQPPPLPSSQPPPLSQTVPDDEETATAPDSGEIKQKAAVATVARLNDKIGTVRARQRGKNKPALTVEYLESWTSDESCGL